MVPHRPFFIGNPGWVRSSACICDFSSIHSQGFSGDSNRDRHIRHFFQQLFILGQLNVLVRWGCNPWAFQILATLAWLNTMFFRLIRVLHWVAPGVFVWMVVPHRFNFPGGKRLMLAMGSVFDNPKGPCLRNRSRHAEPLDEKSPALCNALLDRPSAAEGYLIAKPFFAALSSSDPSLKGLSLLYVMACIGWFPITNIAHKFYCKDIIETLHYFSPTISAWQTTNINFSSHKIRFPYSSLFFINNCNILIKANPLTGTKNHSSLLWIGMNVWPNCSWKANSECMDEIQRSFLCCRKSEPWID